MCFECALAFGREWPQNSNLFSLSPSAQTDLLLEDEIQEAHDEGLEDFDFARCATPSPPPSPTTSCIKLLTPSARSELVLDFVQFEAVELDDNSVGQLQRIGRKLEKELLDLESFRTSKLNRLRITSAVQPSTFAGEKAALLRFMQWYSTTFDVVEPTMDLLRRPDLGERVQQYAEWLESRSLKWSSAPRPITYIRTHARTPHPHVHTHSHFLRRLTSADYHRPTC